MYIIKLKSQLKKYFLLHANKKMYIMREYDMTYFKNQRLSSLRAFSPS